jgi:uncharacterized protein (TIGR03437 family)
VTSTNGGTGNTATASFAVAVPPAIAEAFGSATVPLNHSTSLTFTLTNPAANTIPLTGVGFTGTLSAGLVVSTPSGLSNTCGGTPAAAGSAIGLSGVTLAAQTSCTLSVNVTGIAVGIHNTSATVTSTTGGTGNTSQASVLVVAPAAISKAFGAPSIPLNGATTLTFMVGNTNTTAALTGVGFTDPLPLGLVVASPNGLTGACGGGTITALAGSASVSLSGGTLAAGASCNFSINVTGTTAGAKNNVTGAVISNEGATGLTASASLAVVAPPVLEVFFGAGSLAVNGVISLNYAISNPAANTVALTGVAFTDTFPSGLLVASPNGLSNTCGGTAAAVAGSGSVSLAGAAIPPGGSCTLTVNVTVTSAKVFNTGPTTVVSANGGTGNTASAQIGVLVPITLNTVPAGLSILVNGASYIDGQTLQLPVNSPLEISVATPQAGVPGTQYVFNNWSDGGAASHTITVPAQPTTYVATFITQYQLTLAATPAGSGTVTPASGGFYDAGASVTVTAVANAGYLFNAWTGAANPAASATATVAMSAPESITAGFVPIAANVLNGGSFQQGLAAPNTVLSLFGPNLGCTPPPQVLVNGAQAQVLFASNTQINFVVPAGLGSAGTASLQVVCNDVSSPAGVLALVQADPSIFTLTESGTGQGAVLNLNYTVNGPQSPTSPGSYVFVYGTGFGTLAPAGADGLQHLVLPVTASIGSVAAQVVYAGEAPGYTSGLQQINILVPENVPLGAAIPLQLTVGGVDTQSGVTIAIQ